MPELPEVEVIKQSLNKKIKGKIIQKVSIKNYLEIKSIMAQSIMRLERE